MKPDRSLAIAVVVLLILLGSCTSIQASGNWWLIESSWFHPECSIQRITATDKAVFVLVNILGTDEYRVFSVSDATATPELRWTSSDWPRMDRMVGLDLVGGGDHVWVSSRHGLQEIIGSDVVDYTSCLDTSNPSVTISVHDDGSGFMGLRSKASRFHDGTCDSLFAVTSIQQTGLIRRVAPHPSGTLLSSYSGGQRGSDAFSRLRWNTGEAVTIPEVDRCNDYNIAAMRYASGEWTFVLVKDAPGLFRHLVVTTDETLNATRIDSIPTQYSGVSSASVSTSGVTATLDSGVYYRHDARSTANWIGIDSLQRIPGVGILDRPFGAVLYKGQLWINMVASIVVLDVPTSVEKPGDGFKPPASILVVTAGQQLHLNLAINDGVSSIAATALLGQTINLPIQVNGAWCMIDTSELCPGIYGLTIGSVTRPLLVVPE